MEAAGFTFEAQDGQTIVKEPGSINGGDVVLRDLQDCEVYVLDVSGEVEVDNCTNCKLFFGPVDGPALFKGVHSSKVAVASQQCQILDSSDIELGLYCATRPTVERCMNIRVSCWMGAYPGLTQQFRQCKLDPMANQYSQVHSVGDDDAGFGPSFTLVEAIEWWEPPLQGGGAPENPVPAADGTFYQGQPAESNGNVPQDNGFMDFTEQPGDTFAAPPASNGGAGAGAMPMAPGGSFGAPGATSDHPRVAAMKEKMQQYQAKQEADERSAKTELADKAARHLEDFYQKRQDRMATRAKDNRSTNAPTAGGLEPGVAGNTPWEKALGYIDFNFQRGTAADKARFKNVLFSAKTTKTAA